jgi:hypothetical protein
VLREESLEPNEPGGDVDPHANRAGSAEIELLPRCGAAATDAPKALGICVLRHAHQTL